MFHFTLWVHAWVCVGKFVCVSVPVFACVCTHVRASERAMNFASSNPVCPGMKLQIFPSNNEVSPVYEVANLKIFASEKTIDFCPVVRRGHPC